MASEAFAPATKHAQRVAAVLALLRGDSAKDVSGHYRMSRSTLYKFRKRALVAMQEALSDHRRGPQRPHNRVVADREAQVVALCQRHPTSSSYALYRRSGQQAPSPRTIQRIRARHGFVRFPKRVSAMRRRHTLTPEQREQVDAIIAEKPYLGPERTVWDLQNSHQ